MKVYETLTKNEKSEGVEYKYIYRLIKKEHIIDSEHTGKLSMESFGIEIERYDMVDDTVVNIERNSVDFISPNQSKVHNILIHLYENSVSPSNMESVVELKSEKVVWK